MVLDPERNTFASFKGFSMKEQYDDKTSLRIRAGKADVRNGRLGFLRVAFKKVQEMEDVTIAFIENDIDIISITSDFATLNLGSKNILFNENVLYSTHDGRTLMAENLIWDNRKGTLTTQGLYEYIDENGTRKTGLGFESDNKFEFIKFGQDITSESNREGKLS